MKRKMLKIFLYLFIIIDIILISMLLFLFFNYYNVSKDLSNLEYEVIEVDEESSPDNFTIDWEKLKSINEDIIGWIYIPNTVVSYPILQDDGTEYYLKHNYLGEYSSYGSIFTMDDSPFIQNETCLYGHNTGRSIMFNVLKSYLKQDFLLENQIIYIYTEKQNYKGVVFSSYTNNVYTENENTSKLNLKEKISYYTSKSVSNIDIQEEILNKEDKKILKLVTCAYLDFDLPTVNRYYVVAYLIEV